MPQPFFSICIPVYNMVDTVRLSIESVLHQTCGDWELIIVDDCSTDGTWEILSNSYGGHPKISLHRNEKNLKQWGNLNRCLELVSGEWIGLLPADDTYRPHALETIKREVAKDNDLILWTHAHLCHGEGAIANIVPVYNQATRFSAGELAEILYLKDNIFGELSSYFFRREVLSTLDKKFQNCSYEDYDFWVRFLRSQPGKGCVYWPDILATVLLHQESASAEMIRSNYAERRVLETIGGLGKFGWPARVIFLQYLRALKFFITHYHKIPGDRWSLLFTTLHSLKVGNHKPKKSFK